MNVIVPKVALPQEAKAVEPKANGVPPESSNTPDVYHLWDQRDETQVVDALKGRYLDEFVYSYCRRHKWLEGKRPPECQCTDIIVGLSWLGIAEGSRAYGGITVPLEKMRKVETEDSVEVTIEAIDSKTGSSRIGVASQSKNIRLRTGQVIADEFCVAKAVAKAQRNGIRPLLPVTLIKAWIEAHRVNGNRPALPAGSVSPQVPGLPAPQVAPSLSMTNPEGTPLPQKQGSSPASQHGWAWAPSVGQIRRIFGLAHGHKVGRDQVLELLKAICGVEDPARIGSREKYEHLCLAIENGGVPF